MAVNKINEGNYREGCGHRYVCDSAADVASLPADAPFGSIAIVPAAADLYVKGTTWIKFASTAAEDE